MSGAHGDLFLCLEAHTTSGFPHMFQTNNTFLVRGHIIELVGV